MKKGDGRGKIRNEKGEGERNIVHLLREISNPKNYDSVPNLHYRNKFECFVEQ